MVVGREMLVVLTTGAGWRCLVVLVLVVVLSVQWSPSSIVGTIVVHRTFIIAIFL